MYDGMMLNSSWLGRLAMKYFWQLTDEKYEAFINQAFAGVPDDFSGRLLEIPVGTGVLSLPIFERLKAERIVCADFSTEMLEAARANAAGVSNVEFMQCDVGSLPFDDGSFDHVLSINGFHAFPDKEAAYEETRRVLCEGGTFSGCMYVKGLNGRTDFFVEQFCERHGFFTPPYETLTTLAERLKSMYSAVEIDHVEAFAGFVCRK
ncbi:MAG: class I SAM-dependent methyltransferase [Selenomonadaceae bacterium]|nr:class I SAM-dependent methyltransferase [Selenomonadaceae bacterium]